MKKGFVMAVMMCASVFAGEEITRFIQFKLELPQSSPAVQTFKTQTLELAEIPGVKEMGWLEVEGNDEFNYGVRIVFHDRKSLDAYVAHKDHKSYLKTVWAPNVKKAQLIDYKETECRAEK
jgi:hypothetical protein